MPDKYRKGERVALRSGGFCDLEAGAEGVIWISYDLDPPAYEVEWTDPLGKGFSALMYEEELTSFGEMQNDEQTAPAKNEDAV